MLSQVHLCLVLLHSRNDAAIPFIVANPIATIHSNMEASVTPFPHHAWIATCCQRCRDPVEQIQGALRTRDKPSLYVQRPPLYCNPIQSRCRHGSRMRIHMVEDAKRVLWRGSIGLCLLLQGKSPRASYTHHVECNIGEYYNRAEEEWCRV